MANFRSIFITDKGSAKIGLSPTFSTYIDIQTGDAVTPPAIEELNAGWYRFFPALTPFKHYLGVIDAGSTITDPSERFIPVDVRYSDFDLDTKGVYVISVFDEDSDSVSFVAYLLINGKIQAGELTSAQIEVFDATHTSLFTLSTNSQTNGVFVLNKATPGFIANNAYYAKATIVTSNETLISIDTFITLN